MFANNGIAGLEQLSHHPDVDVILSDINMPEMDGLEFLARVGEKYPTITVIIVSAYDDMPNIRAAMNRGAFDFLVKGYERGDLEATITKAARHTASRFEAMRTSRENDALRTFLDDKTVRRVLPMLLTSQHLAAEEVTATVAFIRVRRALSADGHARGSSGDDRPVAAGETAAGEIAGEIDRRNAHFDGVVSDVLRFDGEVIKFHGDTAQVIFRDGDHARRAVAACLAICDRYRCGSQPAGEVASHDDDHAVSIGLCCSDVLCSGVGSRRYRRLDYAIFGPAVAGAEALLELAGQNQVVVCERVFAATAREFEYLVVAEEPAYQLIGSFLEPDELNSTLGMVTVLRPKG